MIKISGHRLNSRELFHNPERSEEPYEALKSLVSYELGYGGQITEVTKIDGQVAITVVTKLLQSSSTTIFSGTEAEMRVLLEFLGSYVAVLKYRHDKRLKASVFEALSSTSNILLVNFGPLLQSEAEVFFALILWAGLKNMTEINLANDLAYYHCHGVEGIWTLIEAIEYMKTLEVSLDVVCFELHGIEV